jgi:hypothetical protein
MTCLLVVNPSLQWNDILEWGMSHWKRAPVLKLAWWAAVYHIWWQRNVVLHQGLINSEEGILKMIIAGHFCNSVLNRTVCYLWGISFSILNKPYGLAIFSFCGL